MTDTKIHNLWTDAHLTIIKLNQPFGSQFGPPPPPPPSSALLFTAFISFAKSNFFFQKKILIHLNRTRHKTS